MKNIGKGFIMIELKIFQTETGMHHKCDDGDNICVYCKHGTPLYDGDAVLCKKRGLMKPAASCRRFSDDPMKRKIKPLPHLPKLQFFELD